MVGFAAEKEYDRNIKVRSYSSENPSLMPTARRMQAPPCTGHGPMRSNVAKMATIRATRCGAAPFS